jgi:nucleotide-binding universal stress UspA family protein
MPQPRTENVLSRDYSDIAFAAVDCYNATGGGWICLARRLRKQPYRVGLKSRWSFRKGGCGYAKERKEKSGTLSTIFLTLSVLVVVAIVAGIVHSQFRNKRREANTYYGDPTDFENAVCVVYQRLVEATSEHQELTKLLEEKSIDRDDPEARELASAAAERVTSAIAKYAEENGYDLVCEVAYWKKFATRGAAAGDVTDSIVEIIRGR